MRYQPMDQDKPLTVDNEKVRTRLRSYMEESEEELAEEKGSDEELLEEVDDQELRLLLGSASKGRYYGLNEYQFEKCRNCNQIGHISKNCPNDQLIRCHNCLGEHKRERCEANYCFQCAHTGHRSTNCPLRHERNCRRCGKKGHLEAECSILINFRDINHRQNEQGKVDRHIIKCLNCGENGHWQCYLKGGDVAETILKDNLYRKTEMTMGSIELNITNLDLEEERPKVLLSKNQKRKKLNELIHEDVEDYTLESFNTFSKEEDNYKRKNHLKEHYSKKKNHYNEHHRQDSSHNYKHKHHYNQNKNNANFRQQSQSHSRDNQLRKRPPSRGHHHRR